MTESDGNTPLDFEVGFLKPQLIFVYFLQDALPDNYHLGLGFGLGLAFLKIWS